MIQRDYVLRQVHQLAQVLAEVLFRARSGSHEDAQAHLADGLASALGVELGDVLSMPREALVARCSPGGEVSGELALALADLLRESDAPGARVRALWLYRLARRSDAAVPLDLDDRIARLARDAP